ncbi:MAG: hypothetical protein JNM43_19060 [Planctomycetaceae bacterium]|nr:hypothetical protein [Planctomycetaceae bacterium]
MTLREPQRRTLRGNQSRPPKRRQFSERAADFYEWAVGIIETLLNVGMVLFLGFMVKCFLPFLVILVVAVPTVILFSPVIVAVLAYQAGLWETVLYIVSVGLVLLVGYAASASEKRNYVSRGRKLTSAEDARSRTSPPGAHRGLRQPKRRP